MAISTIMATASSGLAAAQAGLRVTSDNIANVSTAGYVRKQLEQSSRISNGMGVGVDITGVKRVADAYLQLASMNAATSAGRAGVRAELLDNAQALFGDPGSENAYFNQLDAVLTAFSQSADDPGSNLRRTQAVSAIQDFVSSSARVNNGLAELTRNTDTRLASAVARVNTLLTQIEQLNGQITSQQAAGADSTGSQNLQSGMLDELAGLMDITIGSRLNGGVTVRSPQGQLLAGAGAATLAYEQSQGGSSFVTVLPPGAAKSSGIAIAGGEIGGLLALRNSELPGLSAQLGEYVAKAAEEINRAANAASAAPAPNSLNGKNTGLDLPTAIEGFAGITTIAITNSAGVVQRRVDIDFTVGQISVDGGAASAFTPANFLTSLDAALGGFGDAGFSNGALTLTAQAGMGVAIADDATTPSLKAGKGFSHFFGLNDLIRSNTPVDAATGLSPASAHGFTPGGTITLRLTNAQGGRERDITVTMPPAGDMQDLLDSLNDNATGVGLYGAFSLDADGRLAFAARPGSDLTLSVAQDTTARGAGGPSLTQLFGLGQEQLARRASSFFLDPAVSADPSRLPFARLDLAAAPGQSSLVTGDGRGALGLSQIADAMTRFGAAGAGITMTSTLSRYAAAFGGQIGRMAQEASSAEEAASALKYEADTRRSSVEGVNLDEELINLTTYQQAFNASARLIQASKDLYDVLLGMI